MESRNKNDSIAPSLDLEMADNTSLTSAEDYSLPSDSPILESNEAQCAIRNNTTKIVSFDVEATPPAPLSRQEPSVVVPPLSLIAPPLSVIAPPPKRPYQRMLIDVDAYLETEVKKDEIPEAIPINIEDLIVPCVTSSPQRSVSQDAAIKAVLGHDSDKGDRKTFCESSASGSHTADLSEDEIAAIVPPELQRNSGSYNSSPGAVRVSGRTPTVRRRLYPVLDAGDDGLHMISATLVGHGSDIGPGAPILVHAEQLWWKRRLWMCISVWMLLAVAVISISTTLTIHYTRSTDRQTTDTSAISNEDATKVPTSTDVIRTSIPPSKSPIASNNIVRPSTIAPSKSPISFSPIPEPTKAATYSLSWGVLSSCSDFNGELGFYEMILSCGGTIQLERSDSITCHEVLGYNDTVDAGKLSCRLNKTESYVENNTGEIYQQAIGLALFTCKGIFGQDVKATAGLSNVTVSNCAVPNVISDMASSFVSLGRFCQERNGLTFRDDFSKCEEGETCSLKTSHCTGGSGGSSPFVDVAKDVAAKLAASYCYDTASCSEQQGLSSEVCNLTVPKVSTENRADLFDPCTDPSNDEADVDVMWSASKTSNDASKRFDLIVRNTRA